MHYFIILVIILIILLVVFYIRVRDTQYMFPCSKCGVLDPQNIEKGLEVMRNSRVVFAGISRDNYQNLPIAMIEKTGVLFKDYRVVVFENDSKDGTKERLKKWSEDNDKVKILTQDFHNKKRPSISFMAQCRNYYIEEIEKSYSDYDYVIVLDMDMNGWDIDGIAQSLAFNNWDAIAANGIKPDGRMYDAFAFRSKEFPENKSNPYYWTSIIPKIQKHYCNGNDLVEVDSAFGGLCIYKTSSIKNVRYNSIDDDCEHILFHQRIKYNGGKIYMNPSLVAYYIVE